MSFIKDLIDKIFKRSQKALPSGTNGNKQDFSKRGKNFVVENYGYVQSPEERLNSDITRFLRSYYEVASNNPMAYPSNCHSLAYSSLVRMNASPLSKEEYYTNAANESNFLDYLHSNSYNVRAQGSEENPSFYHIFSSYDYCTPDANRLRRMYINCNNGNIANLAHSILKSYEVFDNNNLYHNHPNFYMKFCANKNNGRNPRGEKIVIYFDQDDLNYVFGLVNFAKANNPELFKESDRTLPFLQGVDNVASVAKEPALGAYINLQGQRCAGGSSTNSVLTDILRESYYTTVREIAAREVQRPQRRRKLDESLASVFNGYSSELDTIKMFPQINARYHDDLINGMKSKMQVLSINNDIYIDGLPPMQIAQPRNNDSQDYYK